MGRISMAKELFIIRHAKSDWSFQVDDFDRPLNERGFEDAPRMARRLLASGRTPQLLVSSPAKRAITTAQIFAEILQYPSRQIQIVPEIYEASVHDLLPVVNHLDNQYERIALFGHNPGLSYFVDYLCGNGGSPLNLPTCAIAVVQLGVDDWAEVSGGNGALENLYYPKDGRE